VTDVAPQPPDRLLDALCRQTIHLIDATRAPVRRMRVQAGDVSVEVEWPDQPDLGADGAAQVGAPADPAAGDEEDTDRHVIRSPMVGTFYRAPEPGAPPFVEVGDLLAAGDQVGIVEAMKLMNAIQTERPGRVGEMLVPNGTAVEFDQPLLVLAPADQTLPDRD
jgi:acetyl-CoA carboxylase biotin carboxyl carrier protein